MALARRGTHTIVYPLEQTKETSCSDMLHDDPHDVELSCPSPPTLSASLPYNTLRSQRSAVAALCLGTAAGRVNKVPEIFTRT